MVLPTQRSRHRDEALALMDGGGAILDTARDISILIRGSTVSATVIGGVAVVLHGHWRSTKDIDILVDSELTEFSNLLQNHGFVHDPNRREFVRDEIPVHLVLPLQTGTTVKNIVEIEEILTVDLPTLIEMKLRSGTTNFLRAQDLADVIGLIRCRKLTGEFARNLDRSLRPAFQKIVRAIESD